MPLNKNAVIRYKFLDELLSDRRHYYSTRDLWEKCNEYLVDNGLKEVTKRCIELDLNDLEDIPFYADLERFDFGDKPIVRYKDADFSIFSKKLSNDEKAMLSEVLSTLGQFQGLPNFSWLDNLKQILGEDTSRRKLISFSANNYLEYLDNPNLLGELYTVIASKQVIRLSYHTFSDSTVREILFHPYLLKQYIDRWYLIGAADSDGFILNFPLDRIDGFEGCPELRYKDCDEDLEERFFDIVGVTLPKNVAPINVYLWVSKSYYPYVKTKPLFDYQVEVTEMDELAEIADLTPNLPEGIIIKLRGVVINHELINLVLSNSYNIKWLLPERFNLDGKSTTMGEIVARMYKIYFPSE